MDEASGTTAGGAAAAQPELPDEEAGARQLQEKRCGIARCMDDIDDMCNCDEF